MSSGTLPVGRGGTGTTSLTSDKLLLGNGTSGISAVSSLHWDGSGLGIGTTTPQCPLDVTGMMNTTVGLKFGSSDFLWPYTNYIGIDTGTSATRIAIVRSTGNVGIGTTTPSYLLDVNGNFRSSSINTGAISASSVSASGDVTGGKLRLASSRLEEGGNLDIIRVNLV